MWRRIRTNRGVQIALGTTFAYYFKMVAHTSRFVVEPADIYEKIEDNLPLIMTFWHGQHFLTPFVMKPHHKAKVLDFPPLRMRRSTPSPQRNLGSALFAGPDRPRREISTARGASPRPMR